MIKEGVFRRLWIVLSIAWTVVFGYRAISAWQTWGDAHRYFERAQVEAFAENLFEDKGLNTYPGATEATASDRDRAFEEREEAEHSFYFSLLFLAAGPLVICAALRLWRWVFAGSNTN